MAINSQNITNYNNMFKEVSGNTNLRNLADLQDINSISEAANGILASVDDQTKKERMIEYFYDKLLTDTLRIGSENNVFVKYCQTKTVPQGNEKFLLRRWGGLTEHTHPLAEGIPPKSDRMASESYEGTYCSYGRYMEFTDRVDFMLIDPVIAHYTMELGDTAVRMAERLCRQELEANAGVVYPNAKSFDTLIIGDTVGIADYRLHALKFKRILVKPLSGGNYNVICSPEHIYDLVDDPLVVKYMQYTQTAEPYTTGKPVDLFNIRFEETMLDDYAYGYTDVSNPGEYEELISTTVTPMLRLVLVNNSTGATYYVNVKSGSSNNTVAANDAPGAGTTYLATATIKRTVEGAYIKDGSYIPELVKWDVEGWLETNKTNNSNTITVESWSGSTKSTATLTPKAIYDGYTVYQLPVHRSFMFGSEFMVKTGMDGRMNAKMYVKPLGSAGVLDPINQRQSIGWKIDTLGFNTLRAEAMVQFIFVPSAALLTYSASKESWGSHFNIDLAHSLRGETESNREAAVTVTQPGQVYDESDATKASWVKDPVYPKIKPTK